MKFVHHMTHHRVFLTCMDSITLVFIDLTTCLIKLLAGCAGNNDDDKFNVR